jgi:serine phosphatase RsbU (regulator of sigma subunit)
LRTADALTGTLNLRRTARCVVHLAVPYLADWAGMTLVEGNRYRRIDSAGADGFAGDVRAPKLAGLGAAAAELDAARSGIRTHPGPLAAEMLAAFAVPAGLAEGLADGRGVLTTVPLLVPSGCWVLALAGRAAPDADELTAFTERVGRALTAAHLYEERATLARTLRAALVPAPLPQVPGIQLGAAYRPAQETTQIGGDFYDVTPRPDGRWAVSIGDVCGKGVEAAVLTGQVRQSLRTASLVTDDPADALRIVNDTLLRTDGSTFATVAYGVLGAGPSEWQLRLAVGGHPPPLLFRGGSVAPLPVQGTLVGMLPEVSFETVDLALCPGDVVLLYTDGVIEARGRSGVLGTDPVAHLLADCADLTAQALCERLLQLVMEHLDGWPHDDIAMLALRCTARSTA